MFFYVYGYLGCGVNRLDHGVDVTKAVGIGLIITLWVFVGARNVIGVNAVTITHVFECL